MSVVRPSAAALLALAVLAAACTGSPAGDRGRAGFEREPSGEVELGVPGQPEPVEHILGREDWFYSQRISPGDHVPQGARLAALRQARALTQAAAARAPEGTLPVWRNLGPRPVDSADPLFNDPAGGTPPLGWHDVSGRTIAMAVHPRNPDVLYIGGADGGVWKTRDGGLRWFPVGHDQMDSLAIGALAFDRGDPPVLYVGTGEASTSGDSYYGAGVYRSSDAGRTFEKVGGDVFDGATVFKILVGAKQRAVLVATNEGLYRSNDGGQTFERVLAPGGEEDPYGNFISDVVYLPRNRVLAAVGWRGLPGGCEDKNGLYLSSDGGFTFERAVAAGFPPVTNLGRISLSVARSHPDTIYAVVQDCVLMNTPGANTVLNGVYKTETGPLGPWVEVANSQIFASDENSALNPGKIGPFYQPGIQAWYDQYVEVDPTNPQHVIVGLEEIYETDNGGAEWDTIGRYWNFCLTDALPNCNLDPDEHPTTHPDQHVAAFGLVRQGTGPPVPKLYVGNDGGVWSQVGQSYDNDSWTNLNRTLSITQFYYAEPSAGPDYVIYGGTQDNGSQKYEGDGRRWPIVYGGDGGDVAVEPNNPDHTYEEYVYLIMSKSTDGGRTWTSIDTPDSGSSATARFIAPFDLDPLDPDHLVALGRHVWESREGIETTSDDWQEAYDQGSGHVGTALAVRGDTIYTGWCGPCNPNTLTEPEPFASGLASNVGGTWHALEAEGLPNRYVTSITIDPAADDHIFVTISGFSRRWWPELLAGEGHVFESTDGGASFTDISANLPDIPANDTVLVDGRLVVATDVGIFERVQGSWQPLGTGMPAVSTLDLSVVPGQDTVIAATHGRGVWAIDL